MGRVATAAEGLKKSEKVTRNSQKSDKKVSFSEKK